MAAYNRADLIHVAIDSVLVQDFEDYELVIVDDGQQTAHLEVVRSHDDPRIYIRKDVNEGRSPTRKREIAEARGEFVLWMADDDLIAPGVLLYSADGIPGIIPRLCRLREPATFDTTRVVTLTYSPPMIGPRRHAVVSKLYGSCTGRWDGHPTPTVRLCGRRSLSTEFQCPGL